MALTMTNDTANNAWVLEHSTTGSGQTIHILQTQNTFLDKNINLKFTTPAAQTPTLAITDQGSVNLGIATTASEGYFSATASLQGQMTFAQAGWMPTSGVSATDTNVIVGRIAQSTMSTSSASAGTQALEITPVVSTTNYINITQGYEGSRYITIKPMSAGQSATATVKVTATMAKPTIANAAQTISGLTQVTISPTTAQTTTAGGNKYFISMKATVADIAQGNITVAPTINQVGYLGTAGQIGKNTSSKITGNNNTYYATLPTGGVSIVGTATAVTPTLSSNTTTVSNKTPLATSPKTNAADAGTYFFAVNVVAPATTNSNFTYTKEITSGYITDTDSAVLIASINTTSANRSYYLPITSGVLKSNAGSVSATSTNITLSATATQPAAGDYYITATGSGQVGVQTAGWIPTSATKSSNTATMYYKIHGMVPTTSTTPGDFVFSNNKIVSTTAGYVPASTAVYEIAEKQLSTTTTKPSTSTYAEKNVVVPSGGYLVLEGGYYSSQFVSLASLIPDGTTAQAATVNTILKDYKAYDKDGNLLTGTIATYDGTYTYSG